MQPQSIPHVGVTVFDPVNENRKLTRDTLLNIGFRNLTACTSLDDVRRVLDVEGLDLCFFDVTDQAEQTCKLIKDVRLGNLGKNPFIVILVTSWNQNEDLVRQVIDSGADDFIARPYSIGMLISRITLQVEARKKFIVTSSYIGPDRRRDRRPRDQSLLIEVPNTLRAKAADGLLSGGDRDEITSVLQQVKLQRLRQCALRIGIGAKLMSDHIGAGDPPASIEAEINQVVASVEDIKLHVADTDLAHLGPLCEGVLTAIDKIRAALRTSSSSANAAKPLELLTQFNLAVRQVLDPNCNTSSAQSEISGIVARIKARRGDI